METPLSQIETENQTQTIPPVKQPFSALGALKRPTALNKASSSWNDDSSPRSKRTNPIVRALLYVALGLVSFFFFLYITFPYGVIKEVAVSQITENIQKAGYPVRVSIGTLRPHWLTGVQLENVVISNMSDPNAVLKLGIVNVRLNVLPLLWGTLRVTSYVSQAGGSLDAQVDLPVLGVIKGAGPKYALVNFKKFTLDPIFNHGLAVGRGSRDPSMVLLLPLLAKTTAGGSLSGTIQLENNEPANFAKAKGGINLNIAGLYLHIDDTTLQIPKQNFETAKVELNFGNNSVTIGKSTKLAAEDIILALSGKIGLPEAQGAQPNADLDMELTMRGQIDKSLGFIVPNMMRCKPLTNGELKAKLSGPLTAMNCL